MRTVVKVPGSGVVPVIGNGYVETAGRVAQREVEFFGVVAVGIGLAEACRPPCFQGETFIGNRHGGLKAYAAQILSAPHVAAYEVYAYRCFHFVLRFCRERHPSR